MLFKVFYLVLISVREFEHFGFDPGFLSLVVALLLVYFEIDEVTRSRVSIVELLYFTSLTPDEGVLLCPKS
jgi:inner membrane protein involved in colicin E2 resistance